MQTVSMFQGESQSEVSTEFNVITVSRQVGSKSLAFVGFLYPEKESSPALAHLPHLP